MILKKGISVPFLLKFHEIVINEVDSICLFMYR